MAGESEHQVRGSIREVFWAFLRLGLTSFGGPSAHIGYFHDELVKRRHWMDEAAYADLVALCQFLPGPASSQLGFAMGKARAGWGGAIAAWAGFTLPSAAIMICLAMGLARVQPTALAPWLHGLKLAAVAVVAQAVGTMAGKLSRGKTRLPITLAAGALVLMWDSAAAQLVALVLAAAIASRWNDDSTSTLSIPRSHHKPGPLPGLTLLALFAALLVGLPLLAVITGSRDLQLLDRFYRAGALVFGGGHVVLPFLQSAVVTPGWVSPDEFLAGYGFAQALPGPLFTFAAYLGVASHPGPGSVFAGLAALSAVFLPGLLLVAGVLPSWDRWRGDRRLRAALDGANAAVVGVLFATLVTPLATTTLRRPADWLVALGGTALLGLKLPSWAVVPLCAAASWVFGH